MAVGLPGAGIGGLFYILSALAMPVCELARLARGGRSAADAAMSPAEVAARRRLAWRQGTTALGIVGALWATGELLGLALFSLGGGVRSGTAAFTHVQRVLPVSALAVALGSLALVLLGVQVARLVVAWGTAGGAARADPDVPRCEPLRHGDVGRAPPSPTLRRGPVGDVRAADQEVA
jgi:hypothetical protein